MFVRSSGLTKFVWENVTTSTAIARGTLVTFSSGLLIAATSSTAGAFIEGVLAKAIADTDADYAVARLVPVEVPVEKAVLWKFDVTSGLVAADRGLECDLTDGATVNRGVSSVDIVKPVKVLSTTLGIGYVKILGSY